MNTSIFHGMLIHNEALYKALVGGVGLCTIRAVPDFQDNPIEHAQQLQFHLDQHCVELQLRPCVDLAMI
jgi:hypothetical protein